MHELSSTEKGSELNISTLSKMHISDVIKQALRKLPNLNLSYQYMCILELELSSCHLLKKIQVRPLHSNAD